MVFKRNFWNKTNSPELCEVALRQRSPSGRRSGGAAIICPATKEDMDPHCARQWAKTQQTLSTLKIHSWLDKITQASKISCWGSKKKNPQQDNFFLWFNTFLKVTICSFASAAGKYQYYQQKTLTSHCKNLGAEETAGKPSRLLQEHSSPAAG